MFKSLFKWPERIKGALPGEHLCVKHQGNHSHYAEHNCTICQLERTLGKEQRAHDETLALAQELAVKCDALSEQIKHHDCAEEAALNKLPKRDTDYLEAALVYVTRLEAEAKANGDVVGEMSMMGRRHDIELELAALKGERV